MFVFKCLLPVLIVSFIQGTYCKPTDNELTKGRWIGSTVWGWITYPFSWWGSADPTEAPPVDDTLIASTIGPYDNVEIASRNLTIWCNDHTCTTMKCDKVACVNTTCNIYDTDVTGQCREYNMGLKPEEPKPSPTEAVKPATGVTDATIVTAGVASTIPILTSAETEDNLEIEHPLELEDVLSSTITKATEAVPPGDKKVRNSSPQNKI